MLDPEQQETITSRLARVEQQIHVIRGMIAAPAVCSDLLNELAQAEAALAKVGAAILKMHVETCVPAGVRNSEEEGKARLGELVDIFDRFAK